MIAVYIPLIHLLPADSPAFIHAKWTTLPKTVIEAPCGIRVVIRTKMLQRQDIRVNVAWKHSLRAGRGVHRRYGIIKIAIDRYSILDRANGHPPAPKLG